jgi:hypothetical protein
MHDRLGALDGRLSIITAPGRGTVVAGSVPVRERPHPFEVMSAGAHRSTIQP